jgi:hypothetical protein
MNIISLPEFVSFLNDQKPEDFQGEGIDHFLLSNRVEQEDFIPFIYFREETYCRNLVFRNDYFELLVLTWLPQQSTPIYDLSGERCWMVVQSGELTVQKYCMLPKANSNLGISREFETSQKGEVRAVGAPQARRAGDIVYADDNLSLHSICNTAKKPAVSIHLHAGPISKCRCYNEKQKDMEWLKLDYDSSALGQ